MNIEKTINNLEGSINHLEQSNAKMNEEKEQLQIQLNKYREKFGDNQTMAGCQLEHNIVFVLEKKLANTGWYILELEKMNKYKENIIINLQKQLFQVQRQNSIKAQQIQHLELDLSAAKSQITSDEQNVLLKKLTSVLHQKSQLIHENVELKAALEEYKSETQNMMKKYLEQVRILMEKVKQSGDSSALENENVKVKELKQQNIQLKEMIEEKEQKIKEIWAMSEYDQDKACLMHTVQNLRKELMNKGKIISQILEKLVKTDELRQKYEQNMESYEQSQNKIKMFKESNNRMTAEIHNLKQLLDKETKKVKFYEQEIYQKDKNIQTLLEQNEACHELLFLLKGSSNIYKKDLHEQLNETLKKLEHRKNTQKWTDVSELLTVNRKMRMRLMVGV